MNSVVRPAPDMITVLTIPTLLISIVFARGVKSISGECEEGWFDENAVGLGCLLIYPADSPNQESLFFEDAQKYCKDKASRLIELETKLQLKRISNLLKNVTGTFTSFNWWGGALRIGNEEGRNWRWIESDEPVQDWAWGPSEPGSGKDDKFFAFHYFPSLNESYFGADFKMKQYLFPVCQRPATNGRKSGDLSGDIKTQTSSLSIPLIAVASAGGLVVICFILGTVWCFKKRNSDREIVEKNEMYGKQEDYCDYEKAEYDTKVTDNNQMYGNKDAEYADEYDSD